MLMSPVRAFNNSDPGLKNEMRDTAEIILSFSKRSRLWAWTLQKKTEVSKAVEAIGVGANLYKHLSLTKSTKDNMVANYVRELHIFTQKFVPEH